MTKVQIKSKYLNHVKSYILYDFEKHPAISWLEGLKSHNVKICLRTTSPNSITSWIKWYRGFYVWFNHDIWDSQYTQKGHTVAIDWSGHLHET